MSVGNVAEVFESFIPNRLVAKPDLASKIGATYKFIITGDGGGTWLVDLKKAADHVSSSDGSADCTITMGGGEFLDMVNGSLKPQMAFMTGKLKVQGNMGLALKLGNLLS